MSGRSGWLVVGLVSLLGVAPGARAQTADELFRQADAFYQEFTWDRAITLFERFIAEHPQDERVPEAEYKTLRAQIQLGRTPDIEQRLTAYAERRERTLWGVRGKVLLAEWLFDNQRWSSWERIASLYEEAVREYRAAIGRTPISPEQRRELVDIRFKAAGFYMQWWEDRARGRAREHLEAIVREDLDADANARALTLLGLHLQQRYNQPAQAERLWLRVHRDYPNTDVADQAVWYLAQLSESQQNYVLARARYLELRRKYPKSEWEDEALARIKEIEAPQLNLQLSRSHLPGARIPARVHTRNLKGVTFTAYRLDPESLLSKLGRGYDLDSMQRSGERIATWRQAVPDEGKYEFHETKLDVPLKDAGLYLVEASADGHPALAQRVLVNLTGLVLVQQYAQGKLVAYVASRTTHDPVPGVELRVQRRKGDRPVLAASGRTGADGTWTASVPRRTDEDDWQLWTWGRKGNEVVFVEQGLYAWYRDRERTLKAYVYTDRPVYRPGNTVHYRAILRDELEGDYTNLPGQPVRVLIRDARGEEAGQATLTTDEFGTLQGELTLPDDPSLGVWSIQLTQGDRQGAGTFRVEEYRKPEFQVAVGHPMTDVRPGGAAAVPVTATYYFGGPVAGANVKFVVQRSPYYHWWWNWRRGPWDWFYTDWFQPPGRRYGQQVVAEGTVTTDDQGQAIIEFPVADDQQDYTYSVYAEVTDVTRRVVDATGSVTVTQHGFYLNARTEQGLYKPGDDVTLRVKAETADKQPVAARATVDLYRMNWVPEKKDEKTGNTIAGHHTRGEKLWTRTLDTDPDSGEETLTFDAPADGYYELAVSAPDTFDPNAKIAASTQFWVASDAWKGANYDYANLQLVTEKDLYQKGQVARLLVNSPVDDGWLLLTTGAEEIYETRVVKLTGNTTVIELPVQDNWSPNVYLHGVVVGTRQVYFAQTQLQVPPTDRLLNVKVESDQAEYKPRTRGTFTLTTTDANGRPVPAQVSLGITDDSVYAIQEEMAQPIGVFFHGGRRGDSIQTNVSFEGWGEYDDEFAQETDRNARRSGPAGPAGPVGAPGAPPAPAPMATAPMEAGAKAEMAADGAGGGAGGGEEIAIREFFPDTILWQPTVTTDANGRATVTVDFPDSLTTWRATARAITKDTNVGQQVERVVTSKDLIVRLQAPRFFTQLDRATISAVVTNKTSNRQQVAVNLMAEGLVLEGNPLETVTVEPLGQVRIDRQVRAEQAGTATLTATARGADDSDGVKLTYPVIPHGATKFDTATGRVGADGRASFTLDLPAQRRQDATELTVTVNPTLVSTLMDALPFLAEYPYGCVEQTTSRFIPAVLVARVLDYTGRPAQQGGRPPQAPEWWKERGLEDLPEMVRTGVKRLASMQNPDGGFGWFGGMRSDIYMSAYVVYGLSQARLADFAVPEEIYRKAVAFLYANLHQTKSWHDSAAYVAWVLSEATDGKLYQPNGDERKALTETLDRVYAERDELNDYTRALLLLALLNEGRREQAEVAWRNLQAHRIETEHGVHWGENRWGWRWSEDQVETTSFALLAALRMEPEGTLAEKAMQWLVLNRTGGHWYSTKDTATAIYALTRYADVHDELRSQYTARLLVNGREVKGWEVTPQNVLNLDGQVTVDPALLKDGANRLELVRDGQGSLYYSALLEYYTQEEPITGASSYLKADRKYYRVEEYTDPADNTRKTRRELLANGAPVASGDQIEVEVTITSENDFSYIALADPKPAGCEPVDQTSGGTWGGTYAYRELHDTEVTFFIDHLPQGETKLAYRLRAESPGTFHALPHNGFSMYRPDVRCLSDEALVEVREMRAAR